MLAQAQVKIDQAQARIELVQGSAGALPFAKTSFDTVWSSLAFHHLDWSLKQRAAFEIARVLKPGGSFYLLDFSKPHTLMMRGISLILRCFEHTRDQIHGRLPWLLQRAGLTELESLSRYNTWLGTIELLKARKAC